MIGGKYRLAEWIIRYFPKHKTYVEVFGGGGSVILNKQPSKIDVYNDADTGLYSLFNVVKSKPYELINKMNNCPPSKNSYNLLSKIVFSDDYYNLNEVDKAFLKMYIQVLSISGRFCSGYNAHGVDMKRNFNMFIPERVEKRIMNVHKCLKNTYITNLNYDECIYTYDKKSTLFYCDPPYFNKENLYKNHNISFKKIDHIQLSELLHNIKGKVVLSYYYSEEIVKLYEGWYVTHKHTQLSAGKGDRSVELLIMNFKPKGKKCEIVESYL